MTCKKIYSIYPYIFKNEIVIYKNDNTNFAWIQKYKPTIEVRTLVYKVLPQTIFRNIKHVNLYGQNFISLSFNSFAANTLESLPKYSTNCFALLLHSKFNIY